jgi:hypothetical protein
MFHNKHIASADQKRILVTNDIDFKKRHKGMPTCERYFLVIRSNCVACRLHSSRSFMISLFCLCSIVSISCACWAVQNKTKQNFFFPQNKFTFYRTKKGNNEN